MAEVEIQTEEETRPVKETTDNEIQTDLKEFVEQETDIEKIDFYLEENEKA